MEQSVKALEQDIKEMEITDQSAAQEPENEPGAVVDDNEGYKLNKKIKNKSKQSVSKMKRKELEFNLLMEKTVKSTGWIVRHGVDTKNDVASGGNSARYEDKGGVVDKFDGGLL